MDPLAAAERFLDALGTPTAVALVQGDAAPMLLRAKRPDEVLDMVMKRNLVFISWRAGKETGTWVLGFDRNGRVLSWTELS